jgi:DNA-binding response OmpR family regulator
VSPLYECDFDATVIPASLLLDQGFPKQGLENRLYAAGCSLIAFGAAELLMGCALAGCDDFLKEPWSPEELEWRLRKLVLRKTLNFTLPWGSFEIRGLELYAPTGRCLLCGQEQRILRMLVTNRGEPVSRDALFYGIWGKPASERSRVVDVHISSLRKKLVRLFPESEGCIHSVRGVGYLIT